MVRVIAIESAGPGNRARRLCLDDGTMRLTSAAVVRALQLEVEADAEGLEGLLAQTEPLQARERALALLGYRERSSAELRRKLGDDGYPQPVVAEIIQTYERLELLDDARFAGAFARTRASGGYGRVRILRELREKGVDDDTAAAAVDEALAECDEVERARAALRGRVALDRKERERLLRRLISKGFDMSTALRALDQSGSVDDE